MLPSESEEVSSEHRSMWITLQDLESGFERWAFRSESWEREPSRVSADFSIKFAAPPFTHRDFCCFVSLSIFSFIYYSLGISIFIFSYFSEKWNIARHSLNPPHKPEVALFFGI